MKRTHLFLCAGLLLFAAGVTAAETTAAAQNLLKEPLTIKNTQTTTLKDGVYTVANPDDKTMSTLEQTLELNQDVPRPLTFSVESKIEDHQGEPSGNYGVRIDLVHTDGTRTNWVNVGCKKDARDWQKTERTYIPAKPVKSVNYYVQYIKFKGKVHFRNPILTQGEPAKN